MTAAAASKMPPLPDMLQFLPKKADKQPPSEPFKLPEDKATDETTARDPLSLSPAKGEPMTSETFMSLLNVLAPDIKGSTTSSKSTTSATSTTSST